MRTYYTQKNAQHYNRTWRSFLEKTLAATISLIEMTHLDEETDKRARPVRILDAACGTGLLLAQLARLMPRAELYGVDASQAMLTQAADLLRDCPHTHLIQASIADGETAGLPFAPAFFDLITCTNTLHYFSDPVATLRGLRRLLVSTGQLVIEDYVLRGFPFPWKAFEWAIKL
ncbi:MAG: class I SAM-dependent methyltransferase, partial [Chloroflexi bacterium]